MEIRRVIELMNNHAEEICRYLLPNGKRIGNEWRVGNIDDEPGKSLGIHLEGDKAGIWADFATGEKGDLLDLWKSVRNISTVDALNEIKRYLNISDSYSFREIKNKPYRRPEPPKLKENIKALNYLIVMRKLNKESIRRYQIGFMDHFIVFPYYKNGELVNNKYLRYDKNHKKQIKTEKNAEPCLFGWQAIDDETREIVITEGEIDAISMYQFGFQALSVPYGAGVGDKNKWIENDYDLLDRFETIYICMDMDAPGKNAALDIINRLGRHRCKLIKLPYKDVNECLQKGITNDEMAKIISKADYLAPEYLRDISDYDLVEEIRPKNPIKYYSPQFHDKFQNIRFYPAEVTVFGGINGSGKTTFLMQIALDMAAQNKKVIIASFEQKPEKYLKKIIKQACLDGYPSEKLIKGIVSWLSGKIFIYDKIGVPNRDDLFNTFEYAYRRFGVEYFIIDSLTKLGFAEDDYNGQKLFLEKLTNFAMEMNIHIIIVVHSRKLRSEKITMDKMDLKGTGAISDLASNVLLLSRNKEKEAAVNDGRHDLDYKADVLLLVKKQREYGWEGVLKFNYNRNSESYYELNKEQIRYYDDNNDIPF